MKTFDASEVRVVGYEGTVPSNRTPGRHSPVLAHDDEHYRVDHWRGDQVEAVEIVVDDNVTLLSREWIPVPNGYFVVLGDREREALPRLRAELRARAPHIDLPDYEDRLDRYLSPKDATSLWAAIRVVAQGELGDAARRGEDLTELGWWLYGAAMTGEEIGLACRALELSGETEARTIADSGFDRLRIPPAQRAALWAATNLPQPEESAALAGPRKALRDPYVIRARPAA